SQGATARARSPAHGFLALLPRAASIYRKLISGVKCRVILIYSDRYVCCADTVAMTPCEVTETLASLSPAGTLGGRVNDRFGSAGPLLPPRMPPRTPPSPLLLPLLSQTTVMFLPVILIVAVSVTLARPAKFAVAFTLFGPACDSEMLRIWLAPVLDSALPSAPKLMKA